MTPFYATLLFPVRALEPSALKSADFVGGPAFADQPPSRVKDRLRFHRDRRSLESLLMVGRRWHRIMSVNVDHLVVRAVEFVETKPTYAEEKSWMILHLESAPEAPEISALTQVGQTARPGTQTSRSMVSAVLDICGMPSDSLRIDERTARVPSLALSERRDEGDVGLVRWPEADPVRGRLVDLLVLRRDKADVPTPFDVLTTRPTPSYVMAASSETLSIVRLRSILPEHVRSLRTTWLDAFMLELLQGKEVRGLAKAVRARALDSKGKPWIAMEGDFARWRTNAAWEVSVDHAMEREIASQMRESLRTDNILDRIRDELAQHAQRSRTEQTEQLNMSILMLTIASLVSPLFLFLSSEEVDRWFGVAATLNGALLVAIAVTVVRRQRQR